MEENNQSRLIEDDNTLLLFRKKKLQNYRNLIAYDVFHYLVKLFKSALRLKFLCTEYQFSEIKAVIIHLSLLIIYFLLNLTISLLATIFYCESVDFPTFKLISMCGTYFGILFSGYTQIPYILGLPSTPCRRCVVRFLKICMIGSVVGFNSNLVYYFVMVSIHGTGSISVVFRIFIWIEFLFVTWPFLFLIIVLIPCIIIDLLIKIFKKRNTFPKFSAIITPMCRCSEMISVEEFCVFCDKQIVKDGVQLFCDVHHFSHKVCLKENLYNLKFCPKCMQQSQCILMRDSQKVYLVAMLRKQYIQISFPKFHNYEYSRTSRCIYGYINDTLFKLDLASPKLITPLVSGLLSGSYSIYEYRNCLYLFTPSIEYKLIYEYDILNNELKKIDDLPEEIMGISNQDFLLRMVDFQVLSRIVNVIPKHLENMLLTKCKGIM